MKQTMLLKLAPSPEQSTALLETMHAFNDACNAIAETAFAEHLANKFELQKIVYGEARTKFRLSSQLAIRAISKVVDSYKRDKSIKPTYRREGAVTYDERVMSFKGLNTVSLLTLQGRVLVPFRMGGISNLDSIVSKGKPICCIVTVFSTLRSRWMYQNRRPTISLRRWVLTSA